MNSVSPAELIKARFIQNGFVVLPEIAPELADKTMIVSYGFSNRVILQMTNETPKPIYSVTLKISYYDNDKLIQEQYATFKNTLLSGDFTTESIKRKSNVRSRAYRAKVEVVEYK